MSVKVKVLRNDFGKIAAGIKSKAERANATTAFAIEADAKPRAPIRDGPLRASIQAIPDGDVNWVVNVGVEYGARIEYGFNGQDSLGRTYNQAAQPYLTPAAEAQREPHKQRVAKAFEP